MNNEKGSLSIHSENIFPIIKKWLYSDHDIFVRELISNSCDAITKLRSLASIGEADLNNDSNFEVRVILDEENKTIKIIDNGIGMNDEEIKKYINQIAFSGAEDFLNKYKDKAESDQIIGHFGLGFYSAFMVATQVEINTLSHQPNSKPVKWTCDGGTEFEMEEGNKSSRGTEITLYIGEEGVDFLNEYTLTSTIKKYCSFMPYPIILDVVGKENAKDEDGNDIVDEKTALNNVHPLYTKQPSECSDEEYISFYKETFHDFKDPLFWIHLNMDYPFNIKGILYFPKFNNEFDTLEGEVKLYNNQVFVADNIKEVVPEFLLLLKGVIDCPDLPLNVSRSFLQNDGFVKKTSEYITKKVADKLSGLFKTKRDEYEQFWDDISPFVKFGLIKNEKFAEKVKDIVLFKTNSGKYMCIDEYLAAHEGKLTNEIYYVTDELQQSQYTKLLIEHDIEPVILTHNIDSAFISYIENLRSEIKFKRVDSDLSDLITEKEEVEADDKSLETLSTLFKKVLNLENLNIKLQNFKNENISGMIVLSEEGRRMQDMMKMYSMNGMGMDMGMFPSDETLVLNKKHPLVAYTLANTEDVTSELIAKQIYDLAMISHKPLSSDAMSDFIKRSNDILLKLI